MTKDQTTNNVITTFYSDDRRLMSEIVVYEGKMYVDFYKDEILVETREVGDHSIQYASDIAENFIEGIIRVDPDTWRLHGI